MDYTKKDYRAILLSDFSRIIGMDALKNRFNYLRTYS